MSTFSHSVARFAVWNLAGNTPFSAKIISCHEKTKDFYD